MAKRYTDLQIGKGLLRTLLDRFNKSLQDFAAAHPHVHYIDLRGTLVGGPDYRRDWINELHPTSGGFKKIAQKMQDAMLGVLGG
jgi:hypothetical protein